MNQPTAWPFWVVSREPRPARATFGLCIVAFAMVAAAALSAGPRGVWFELILAIGFLSWAAAQWSFVERRRLRDTAFRRGVERDILALSHAREE